MRNSLLVAASALALVTAACNKNDHDADDVTVTNADVAATNTDLNAATPAVLSDADFANAVAGGGHYEIHSAEMAATQASSADVKALAAMIKSDHEKAGADLKTAAAAATPPVTPSDAVTAAQQADLDTLKGLTGAAFDKAYVAQQIAAHQGAIAAVNAYAAGGASASLKAFAAKVGPVMQTHLDKLNALPK